MPKQDEPKLNKISCPYCGDAPVNHAWYYFESIFSTTMDAHASVLSYRAPKFLKKFVDKIPLFLFHTLNKLGLVKYSTDLSRANTFRSKVIWEEARKRGIEMEQIILLDKPLDQYRAKINGRNVYFDSIPILPEFLYPKKNWDDKKILKEELKKHNVPVPVYLESPFFGFKDLDSVFSKLPKPIIVKPRVGSRGRHTTTNINTVEQFKKAIKIVEEMCSRFIVEEHLMGDVCRATFVNGELVGFYRGQAPTLVGDGKKTILELIEEKDKSRHERVEKVHMGRELEDYIARCGYTLNAVLPKGEKLQLTHRVGRLFGGVTKEMLSELHPSFIPILKKAEEAVGLSVVGFDVIVPDPTLPAESQRWGVIECNTLPFIDLHYYALEGKPQNIAGKIWDLWN